VLVKTIRKSNSVPIYTEAIAWESAWYYGWSVSDGKGALIGEMNNMAKTCPYTRVLLLGYSQGASVVGEVLTHNYNSLSAVAKTNFDGAVLLGDPTYRPGEKIDAVGDGTSNGAFFYDRTKYSLDKFRALNAQRKAVLDIRSYCKPADMWCQSDFTPNGATVHSSYGDPTTVSKEISFLLTFASA
jgi:hypothetical protein